MEDIRQLRREALGQLDQVIRGNMTKTLLLAQGFYKEQGIWYFREGYHYYAFLVEQTKVGGLMAFSPNRRLYMSIEESGIFKKMDFLKLINRYDPLSIKADEHTAEMMIRWLDQIKRYHREERLCLMRRRFTSDSEVRNALPAGLSWLQYDGIGPNMLSFVRTAEQHFNQEMSLQMDMSSSLSRRMDDGEFYILLENGVPVAQGAIELESVEFVVFGNIFVKPECRGKGYGRILMEALLAEAKKRGKVPYLFVAKDNPGAIHLYETCGFSTVREYMNIHLTHIPVRNR